MGLNARLGTRGSSRNQSIFLFPGRSIDAQTPRLRSASRKRNLGQGRGRPRALWCNGQAADRICPANRELRAREAFEHEQLQLLPLPDNPFNTDHVVAVHVGKTPYARFNLNDYSVPHTYAQRIVTIRATPDRVLILDGLEVLPSILAATIAEHRLKIKAT